MFKNNNFIERSLGGALSFFKESIFADEYALKKGLLQSLDPRVKSATFFLFIIQVLMTKNIVLLACLYLLCLLFAVLSGIRLGFFLKRTWVFIPFFSLLIVIPALFSIFSPGDTLVSFNFAGARLDVTHQGLNSAALFVTRVATSVSYAVLLSITTKHFELLKVLRVFRVPQIFVMTAGMCYRYLYLFVDIVENTYLAIKSRVGRMVSGKRGRHIVASSIASLWQRSYQLNEDVYKAMLSRGYTGESFVFKDFKIRLRDRLWMVLAAAISVSVFMSDIFSRRLHG